MSARSCAGLGANTFLLADVVTFLLKEDSGVDDVGVHRIFRLAEEDEEEEEEEDDEEEEVVPRELLWLFFYFMDRRIII